MPLVDWIFQMTDGIFYTVKPNFITADMSL